MSIVTDPDHDLVQQARAGDFAAFERLVGKYQQALYGLVRRIVRNAEDAGDVVQETFLSVIENLYGFRGEAKFATWISRIATNYALKVLRKRKGLPTVPLETAADPDDGYNTMPHPEYITQWRDNPERLAEDREVRRFIEEALDELDDKYRLVFLLRDVQGLSTQETAVTLGITAANVKVRLLRARLMLRERLTKAFGDDQTRVIPKHTHE